MCPFCQRQTGWEILCSAWILEGLGPVLAWFLSQPMWSWASYLLYWALAFSAIKWGDGRGKQWDRAEGPRYTEWTLLFCLLVRCSLLFCQWPVAVGRSVPRGMSFAFQHRSQPSHLLANSGSRVLAVPNSSPIPESLVFALMSPPLLASQVVLVVKNLPVKQEMWVQSLGQEDPLE